MMKIHVAVCDDDEVFLQHFQAALTHIAQRHHLTIMLRKFSSSTAFLQDYEEKHARFDLVFLDIDLPQQDGKAVAARLRALDRTFLLVFVTSLANEVFQIFEYDTAYFLPKAQFDEKIEHVLLLLLDRLLARRQTALHCVVRSETGRKQTVRFVVHDILYVESVARDIFVHTEQARFHVVCVGFEQLKQDLLGFGLVEIHRTCAVNARYIDTVELDSVVLQNGTVLPLSRRKRQNVFAAMSHVLEDELQ